MKRKLIPSVLTAMLLFTMLCGGAFAADSVEENIKDGSNPDSEYNYQPMTPPTEAELAEAEESAAEMTRVVELLGLGYRETTRSADAEGEHTVSPEDYAEAIAILEKYGPVRPQSPLSAIAGGVRISSYTNLNFTPVKQSNGYYCGPASAYMVLKDEGCSVTQSGLAGNSFLQTDRYSQTPFDSNWETTMNYYSNHTYRRMWGDSGDSTNKAIELTDAAITTLYSSYGVIYDTIQYPSKRDRLAGYPLDLQNTVYHYVAGEGYNAANASNRLCLYVDPNGARPDAYGHQEIGFRLMATLVKDRGIVY